MSGAIEPCNKEGKIESFGKSLQELEIRQVRTESALDRIDEKLEDQKSALEKIASALMKFEQLFSDFIRFEAGLNESKRHRAEIEDDLNTLKGSIMNAAKSIALIEVDFKEIRDDVVAFGNDLREIERKYDEMNAHIYRLLFINRALVALAGLILTGAIPILFEKLLK